MTPKPLIQSPTEIRLNNQNEVHQILGNPPSWILHWGVSLVFITVLIFGILVWLIKYPDTIIAKIKIVTENPVIRVITPKSGVIANLFVQNNQEVEKGTLLATIENAALLDDIEKLNFFLNQIEIKTNLPTIPLIQSMQLGILQDAYSALVHQIKDYRYAIKQNSVSQKITAFNTQIEHTIQLNKNLTKQKNTLEEEVSLFQKDFNRNKDLFTNGVVPKVQVEKSEIAFLQKKRQTENIENQLVQNAITIEQLKIQLIDLHQNKTDEDSEQILAIQESISQLKNDIKQWKEKFLITAPISGKVSFDKLWHEQQFLSRNENILNIVPLEGTGHIMGKAILPIANSGKVKPGQVVNIRLDGFPFQEYGIIKAEVNQISLVPSITTSNLATESYQLDISLPDNLLTSYSKKIPFRQEMQGTAHIITEDRRVLERIFDRIYSMLRNN